MDALTEGKSGRRNPTPVRIVSDTQIERPDLVALVTDSIRQQILDGVYTPGSVLPGQGKLAATYNVSVNVIREALRNLRSLGLVEVSQGRSPHVRGLSTDASISAFTVMLSHVHGSLNHLMETRAPLEIQVASLAAERATPEHIERITQAIESMKRAHGPQALVQCDQAFHRSLAVATGNPVLVVMIDTLAGLQVRFTQEAHTWPGITESTIAEHTRILRAIQSHDAKAAGQLMLEHLNAVQQRIPSGSDPAVPLPEDAFVQP